MAWRIDFDPAADRELAKLDPQTARRILSFLNGRLAKLEDPRTIGEGLKGDRLGAFWKYRVGDYRVIVRIEDYVLLILVLRIGHRKNVYKN